MNRERRLSIAGCTISPGERREVLLKTSETFLGEPVRIPLTVVRGRKDGPVVFVVAAVHGNEINGVDIVRQLIYEIDPARLKGTLVAAPVVNVQGFHVASRFLPEHRDLNRCFPGKPGGNNAQSIAHTVFAEIVRKCDFGIDLHTAGEGRLNLPQIRGDLGDARVRRLARATGSAVLIHQPGPAGSLRRAATRAGVPTVLFEAGEPGRFDPRVSAAGLRCVLQTLVGLHMYPKARSAARFKRPPLQITVRRRRWIRAERGGILDLRLKPGDLVYKGDVIGRVLNPYGKLRHKLRSDATGIVVGVTTQPLCAPGTALVHVAELKRTLRAVEQRHKALRRFWRRPRRTNAGRAA